MRSGAKYVMLAMTSWFLFLPAILALGIRRFDYALLIAIPALVTVGVAFAVTRRREIRRPIQYVGFALMMLAGMTLSRLFGPLILMPSLLATSAVVYQAHPDRGLRRMGLVGSVCAIVLPVLLELSGVLPASYAFEHGTLVVLPQLTELPRVATLVFLGLTNVAIAVVPSLYVAQLRNELAETQRREQLQGWNFRRLGRDLIAAKGAG